MSNVTKFPDAPERDLIAEMKGCERLGNEVRMQGRIVPNMVMYDRRPGRDEIEFSLDGRVMFGFPAEYAWDAAAFAFAAMAVGAGCDPLNFEPADFSKKVVSLADDETE
ncbi:hypothetical protein QIH87_50095 (plasmid) [Bradyrhizobium elkanii]|jgi:hypothetical protein|uniref:hypothetical protein n=1 Tax=Bradyrhizobium elkanii TaxID=29448 RepID=UPI002714668E|nr:hypothetical protein [Bradyrhizobium elkanii]WLB14784.1 hypothetical protein QIH87_50095 [Bradyrhizobium elkanii]WLB69124.1 hypothetical protein QIH89_27820 [Bradyrhizobium elkanii]